MKRETKIRAIERLLVSRAAAVEAEQAADSAAVACQGGSEEYAASAAVTAWQASQRSQAAAAAWKCQSRPQRDYAASAVEWGLQLGATAARIGGSYSGVTHRKVTWGEAPGATTSTSRGKQYSRRCTYRRIDAEHRVMISAEGMIDLLDAQEIARASAAEGLPLISYRAATGEATWVVTRHRAIYAQRGWVAAESGTIYHSTKSLDHARRGVTRKARLAAQAAVVAATRQREQARAERRARLVVRLCRGAVATVADARAAGYCEPGIRAWQERHGIGDSAPLADLVRTGDEMATRLAFALARRMRRSDEQAVAAV
jgi:hypothetical protein